MNRWDDIESCAKLIAALREFAALLEADRTILTPNMISLWAFLHRTEGTEAERFAAVFDFAETHGVTVTQEWQGDRKAEKQFGPILLRICAFADDKPEARLVTRADDATPVAA